MNQYDYKYQTPPPSPLATGSASLVSSTMKRVYVKMFLGLLVTAFTAMYAASTSFINFYITHSWLMWVLMIAEFGMVIAISGAINKLSSATATLLFYLFAIVNGLMLSTIFVVYAPGAIAKTFFITAGTFGAMSIYGYFTNSDLTKWGAFFFMALIGLIIASVVNLFVHSSGLDWIISIVGVLLFVGLTAWDTQQIKRMAMVSGVENQGKLATYGALSLYLDFINLFIYLLRIFGNRN